MKIKKIDKLKLEEVGENEWRFVCPKSCEKSNDLFFEALDYAEEGNFSKARQLLKKAIEIFPEHIDAIAHLGMMSSDEKAKELNEKAFEIGFSLVSKNLDEGSKLEWGWMENRPFLRVCHEKGLELLEKGKLDEAIKLFNQMLKWNFNDNQGIRQILADIYANNNMNEEMMELSKKYPDSYDPSMNFGLALALFKQGKKQEADKILKKAVKDFPLCEEILLEDKPKKPKSEVPGYITFGGADQAYEFWESQEKAWKDEKIREWLKEIIGEKVREDVKE